MLYGGSCYLVIIVNLQRAELFLQFTRHFNMSPQKIENARYIYREKESKYS